MAIWQYSFHAFPASEVETVRAAGEHFLSLYFDVLWQSQPASCDCLSELSSILPLGKSWSKSMTLFGNGESNVVELTCKDGVVQNIFIRIDFRTDYRRLLDKLIQLLAPLQCLLIGESSQIAPLDAETIINQIQSSRNIARYNILASGGNNN